MAEILGVGLSHYPGPCVPVEYWPTMLNRNVEIGHIDGELFGRKERWPEPMRAEWGADQGVGAAKAHRKRLLAGFARLRAEIDAFDPDFLVVWGDDQFENFRRDCIPAFCIGIFDTVTGRPYGHPGPFKTKGENAWNIPNDTVLTVRGHPEAANALCRRLLEHDFDMSYAMEFRHPAGLAHSFNNTVLFLDYERRGFNYPLVPIHVNCYGSQMMKAAAGAVGQGSDIVSPPSPSPSRCFDLGRDVARFFADSPWRVALVASSSWSHGSLTVKHGRLYPDIAADRARYRELAGGEFARWRDLSRAELEDSGQHEVLNWICLAGAMTELGQSPTVVDFVESYVFNSSKCFAYFPSSAVK